MPILTLSSTTPSAGTIGAAGTLAHAGTDKNSSFNSGVTVSSLNYTTGPVDGLVIALVGGGDGTAAAVASAVGSVNTTGWQLVNGPCYDATFGGGVAIWMGVVVNGGAADTLTATWQAHQHTSYLSVLQFTPTVAQTPPIYQVDHIGGPTVGTPGTAISYPSLTPTGTGELYMGVAVTGGTPSAGSTAGFTYSQDAALDEVAWNAAVSAVVAPTCTQSPSSTWSVLAALIRVFASAATVNSNTVTLQQVPAGRQWVVSQIGYEILPVTNASNITVNVTMNQRALYSNVNGNGGANQGPPFIAVKPGDNLTVTWANAPVGSSCIANFFYTEYDAYVTPNEIGNVV